jgi:hypothetical protein
MPGIKPGQRITKTQKDEIRAETNNFFANHLNQSFINHNWFNR